MPARSRSTFFALICLVLAPAVGAAQDWTAPPGAGAMADRLVVYDFAVAPQDVKLNQGFTSQVLRNRPRLFDFGSSGQDQDQEKLGIAQSIASAFAADLTEALADDKLPAVAAAGASAPTPATINVTGAFLSIDQGNEAQRIVVGFGAGQSQVAVVVDLSQSGKLLARFEVAANSGHKPGSLVALAKGPAALVASGGARAVLQQIDPEVSREVKSAAKDVAKRIRQLGQQGGWLRT